MADLLHGFYDPAKAHAYYLKTRKLKGRKKAAAKSVMTAEGGTTAPDPRARARKKQEIAQRIASLEQKLVKLELLIRKKETEAAQASRKSAAKSERAAKDAAKPATAADKAKKARDAKQYRAKNQQKLKSKSKAAKSGGSATGSTDKKATSDTSVKELKSLATKVRGQIATAKTRLRSL